MTIDMPSSEKLSVNIEPIMQVAYAHMADAMFGSMWLLFIFLKSRSCQPLAIAFLAKIPAGFIINPQMYRCVSSDWPVATSTSNGLRI